MWCRAGVALLNARPLNLLRYPRRASWVHAGVWRTALWALLTGMGVGSVLVVWQVQRHAQLQAQRGPLQASLQLQLKQQAEVRQAQTLARLQTRLQERATSWQVQRQQFMRLHAQLSQEAEDSGLRLRRWQADGHKLTLLLWLPHPERVPGLVTSLSKVSLQPWTLQSMASPSEGEGVEAVLEVPWPTSVVGARRP